MEWRVYSSVVRYSGCYGQISVTFYGFNTNGNRGIAAGLGNIQKLRDGEPLGGKANAAEEFETYDDDDFLSTGQGAAVKRCRPSQKNGEIFRAMKGNIKPAPLDVSKVSDEWCAEGPVWAHPFFAVFPNTF